MVDDIYYSDWSDSFDDMDGGDWGYYLSGPDDYDFERLEREQYGSEDDDDYGYEYELCGYEPPEQVDYDSDYDPDQDDREPDIEMLDDEEIEKAFYSDKEDGNKIAVENNNSSSRQIEIIKWLDGSEFAKPLKSSDGFFILRGHKIQLNDGAVSDILDWLFKEKITGKKSICGYNIVYTKPGGRYLEKLTFFKSSSKNREVQRTPVNFTRKIKILHRLSKSKFAVKLKRGEGFFVYRGNLVQLQNGTKVEVLEWLEREGITSGKNICDYRIVGSKPDEPYLQKWTFFKLPPV